MILLITVYFTASDEREAMKIGESLVSEGLAACINVFPVKSVFRWKGKIKRCGEFGVFAKTEGKLFNKIVKRIRELHSYELPVIEKIDSKTYKEVEEWITGSVR